jgi:hypothetical protein
MDDVGHTADGTGKRGRMMEGLRRQAGRCRRWYLRPSIPSSGVRDESCLTVSLCHQR